MADTNILTVKRFPGLKPPLGTPIDPYQELSQGLVGVWVMNEGAGNRIFDASERGFTGVFANNTIWQHGSLYFDGTDDAVDLGVDTRLAPPSLSIIAQISNHSASGVRQILAKDEISLERCYQFRLNAGKVEIIIFASDLFDSSISPSAIPATGKNIIAGTYDQTTIRTYVNGVLASSDVHAPGGGALDTGIDVCGIGARRDGATWNEDYLGNIHFVYLYNRALPSSQIQSLHADPYQMFVQPRIYYSIPAVGGWTHKWNTIAAANIAEINTIPLANIAKINTI